MGRDLFGFGKNPDDDEVVCNCGALEPDSSGIHTLDCPTYDKQREQPKPIMLNAADVHGPMISQTQREIDERLRDVLKAANPGAHRHQQRQDAADYIRATRSTRPRQTFRVSSYDAQTGLCTPIEPWTQSHPATLKDELKLAYRIIAELVEMHGWCAIEFSPDQMRRITGKEPMLMTLFMSVSGEGDRLQMSTTHMMPDPDDDAGISP